MHFEGMHFRGLIASVMFTKGLPLLFVDPSPPVYPLYFTIQHKLGTPPHPVSRLKIAQVFFFFPVRIYLESFLHHQNLES